MEDASSWLDMIPVDGPLAIIGGLVVLWIGISVFGGIFMFCIEVVFGFFEMCFWAIWYFLKGIFFLLKRLPSWRPFRSRHKREDSRFKDW